MIQYLGIIFLGVKEGSFMNYDLIKNTLLEIIKEAKNLDNEDLEAVGKTNVLVKKGRAEEFRTRAYEYFEYLNNVLINDNIDYVTEVYNTLDKEISLENNEYYNSKSFDIMNSNSKAVAKLKALKGSIRSIDKSYNILVKDLKRALMLGNTLEQKETLGKINKEIDSLLENKNMLDEEIKNLANIINTKVIDYIKEEMARILQDYRTTTYGTKIAFGLDGKSILAKDKEEYDSLFNLKKLLEEVNKDNVVIVDDFLCINPENEEYVRNLLNNSNVFKRLKREKEQEISDTQVTFENPNEELNDLVTELEAYLDKIAQKISNYRGKSNPEIIVTNKIGDKCWAVLKEDIDEANRIIEIIKILQEPSNNMENVWNIASVSKENIAKFKELVNATHYSKDRCK